MQRRIHKRDITLIADFLLFVLMQGRMAAGKQFSFLQSVYSVLTNNENGHYTGK